MEPKLSDPKAVTQMNLVLPTGQHCRKGHSKSTYGTGCFLLMHTGTEPVESDSGLLSTIAFKLGPKEATQYALEGSIAICGMAVAWLRDQLGLISSAKDSEAVASAVPDTGTQLFNIAWHAGSDHDNPMRLHSLCFRPSRKSTETSVICPRMICQWVMQGEYTLCQLLEDCLHHTGETMPVAACLVLRSTPTKATLCAQCLRASLSK
jgi:hypothetical protein